MKKLQYTAEKAIDWFEYNGMKLNSSKCHLLVCRHKYESMIAKIGNEQIIETNRITLLGILIESELKFESYLKLICNKASSYHNSVRCYHFTGIKC